MVKLLTVLAITLCACEMAWRAHVGAPLLAWQNAIAAHADLLTTNLAVDYHPQLGWVLKENFGEGSGFATGEFGVRMNSDLRKPIPRGAILAVGDSFTAGSEVDNAESWPAQLERLLSRPVVNAAAGGWGADQIVLRAEELLPVLEPSAIIVSIMVDDIERAQFSIYGGGAKPWFTVDEGKLVPHNAPVVRFSDKPDGIGLLRSVLGYSELVNAWGSKLIGPGWHDAKMYRRESVDTVAVTCLLLERLADATDVPLVLVMQYGGGHLVGWSRPSDEAVAVLGCASTYGYETIDTWDALAAVRDRAELCSMYVMHGRAYGHMSPAGNGLVARLVAGVVAP